MSDTVPERWEVKRVDQVATVFAGGTPSRSKPEYYGGRIPWVKSGEVNSPLIFRTEETISELALKESSAKWAKRGSVLVAMYGATAGKSARLMVDAALNQAVSAINGHVGIADNGFLLYSIKNNTRELLNTLQGSGQPNLSGQLIKSLNILVPPLLEQQKIATILSSVDAVIEKTRAQIDKLKDLKTGMMQELLTKGIGHTEFKDSPVGRIPANWEVVELGTILQRIDSGWSPNCSDTPPQAGEWGVLKVSAVTRGEFLENESKVFPDNLTPKEHIRVHKNDVLLTRANGVASLVGKCVIVRREPTGKLMMSDKILRLKPSEKISSEYLLHTFNSHSTRRQIESSWGGSSGQKNISQADIKAYLMPLPPMSEQIIIASSLSQLEHFLYCKNINLNALERAKSAIMQDLLTGKVRVNVEKKEPAVA